MADSINFNSDKDLNRFEFFKRSLLIIASVIAANFIYNSRHTNSNDAPIGLIIFDSVVCIGLLIWIFTSRIVKEIQIDLNSRELIVYFLGAFKESESLQIPLADLTYKFVKEPSRHQAKKWALKVYNKGRKVFQIETNQDGFSQETLENLVLHLSAVVCM